MYKIEDRLRCKYNGRDFSGPITTVLPTGLMLEAAERIERMRCALERIVQIIELADSSSCSLHPYHEVLLAKAVAKDALEYELKETK